MAPVKAGAFFMRRTNHQMPHRTAVRLMLFSQPASEFKDKESTQWHCDVNCVLC
jgi:hypothetical protein